MSFSDGINNFVNQIQDDIIQRVEFLALYIFNGVVSKSPVDTGRFRASWTISEDNPITSYIDNGAGLNAPPTPLALNLKRNPVVYVSNYTPYAEPLEFGRSAQAPAGMVGVTLSEVQAFSL